jgi:hypothetical protein
MPVNVVQNNSCRAADNSEKNGEEGLFPPFHMEPGSHRREAGIPLLVCNSPDIAHDRAYQRWSPVAYPEYVAKRDNASYLLPMLGTALHAARSED